MTTPFKHKPACARCGQRRDIKTARSALCADCRYVLSDKERALWNMKARTAA